MFPTTHRDMMRNREYACRTIAKGFSLSLAVQWVMIFRVALILCAIVLRYAIYTAPTDADFQFLEERQEYPLISSLLSAFIAPPNTTRAFAHAGIPLSTILLYPSHLLGFMPTDVHSPYHAHPKYNTHQFKSTPLKVSWTPRPYVWNTSPQPVTPSVFSLLSRNSALPSNDSWGGYTFSQLWHVFIAACSQAWNNDDLFDPCPQCSVHGFPLNTGVIVAIDGVSLTQTQTATAIPSNTHSSGKRQLESNDVVDIQEISLFPVALPDSLASYLPSWSFLLGGLGNWDGLLNSQNAITGYTHEKQYAFFPLYPSLLRITGKGIYKLTIFSRILSWYINSLASTIYVHVSTCIGDVYRHIYVTSTLMATYKHLPLNTTNNPNMSYTTEPTLMTAHDTGAHAPPASSSESHPSTSIVLPLSLYGGRFYTVTTTRRTVTALRTDPASTSTAAITPVGVSSQFPARVPSQLTVWLPPRLCPRDAVYLAGTLCSVFSTLILAVSVYYATATLLVSRTPSTPKSAHTVADSLAHTVAIAVTVCVAILPSSIFLTAFYTESIFTIFFLLCTYTWLQFTRSISRDDYPPGNYAETLLDSVYGSIILHNDRYIAENVRHGDHCDAPAARAAIGHRSVAARSVCTLGPPSTTSADVPDKAPGSARDGGGDAAVGVDDAVCRSGPVDGDIAGNGGGAADEVCYDGAGTGICEAAGKHAGLDKSDATGTVVAAAGDDGDVSSTLSHSSVPSTLTLLLLHGLVLVLACLTRSNGATIAALMLWSGTVGAVSAALGLLRRMCGHADAALSGCGCDGRGACVCAAVTKDGAMGMSPHMAVGMTVDVVEEPHKSCDSVGGANDCGDAEVEEDEEDVDVKARGSVGIEASVEATPQERAEEIKNEEQGVDARVGVASKWWRRCSFYSCRSRVYLQRGYLWLLYMLDMLLLRVFQPRLPSLTTISSQPTRKTPLSRPTEPIPLRKMPTSLYKTVEPPPMTPSIVPHIGSSPPASSCASAPSSGRLCRRLCTNLLFILATLACALTPQMWFQMVAFSAVCDQYYTQPHRSPTHVPSVTDTQTHTRTIISTQTPTQTRATDMASLGQYSTSIADAASDIPTTDQTHTPVDLHAVTAPAHSPFLPRITSQPAYHFMFGLHVPPVDTGSMKNTVAASRYTHALDGPSPTPPQPSVHVSSFIHPQSVSVPPYCVDRWQLHLRLGVAARAAEGGARASAGGDGGQGGQCGEMRVTDIGDVGDSGAGGREAGHASLPPSWLQSWQWRWEWVPLHITTAPSTAPTSTPVPATTLPPASTTTTTTPTLPSLALTVTPHALLGYLRHILTSCAPCMRIHTHMYTHLITPLQHLLSENHLRKVFTSYIVPNALYSQTQYSEIPPGATMDTSIPENTPFIPDTDEHIPESMSLLQLYIPWPLPAVYASLQSRYWNIGFLQYYSWNQIPNFIFATPIFLFVLCISSMFFKIVQKLIFIAYIYAYIRKTSVFEELFFILHHHCHRNVHALYDQCLSFYVSCYRSSSLSRHHTELLLQLPPQPSLPPLSPSSAFTSTSATASTLTTPALAFTSTSAASHPPPPSSCAAPSPPYSPPYSSPYSPVLTTLASLHAYMAQLSLDLIPVTPSLLPIYVHLLGSAIIALFFMHIQVTTRFLFTNPVAIIMFGYLHVYHIHMRAHTPTCARTSTNISTNVNTRAQPQLAPQKTTPPQGLDHTEALLYIWQNTDLLQYSPFLLWGVVYSIVGTCMFASFLPWT